MLELTDVDYRGVRTWTVTDHVIVRVDDKEFRLHAVETGFAALHGGGDDTWVALRRVTKSGADYKNGWTATRPLSTLHEADADVAERVTRAVTEGLRDHLVDEEEPLNTTPPATPFPDTAHVIGRRVTAHVIDGPDAGLVVHGVVKEIGAVSPSGDIVRATLEDGHTVQLTRWFVQNSAPTDDETGTPGGAHVLDENGDCTAPGCGYPIGGMREDDESDAFTRPGSGPAAPDGRPRERRFAVRPDHDFDDDGTLRRTVYLVVDRSREFGSPLSVVRPCSVRATAERVAEQAEREHGNSEMPLISWGSWLLSRASGEMLEVLGTGPDETAWLLREGDPVRLAFLIGGAALRDNRYPCEAVCQHGYTVHDSCPACDAEDETAAPEGWLVRRPVHVLTPLPEDHPVQRAATRANSAVPFSAQPAPPTSPAHKSSALELIRTLCDRCAVPGCCLPERTARAATAYVVPDGPKMLRETLCVAQTRIGLSGDPRAREHVDRLQRLVDECDRHRPIGPDEKHGTRHTPTCGCDVANGGESR